MEWMKCIPNYELLPHNKKNDRYRDCGRNMWSGGLGDLQLCRPSYTLHPLQAVVGPYVCHMKPFVTADLFLQILREAERSTVMLFLHAAF